jgi:hypothetical protein
MFRLLRQADALLRESETPAEPARSVGPSVAKAATLLVFGGLFYGGVMGSYGGWSEGRFWQALFSGVKVPLLLLVTFLLALPSFFVLNTLLGVRRDFAVVLRALVISQSTLTLVLAALAPYTMLWYVSFAGYPQATVFNGCMFALASLAGQFWLRRAYLPLLAQRPVHRWLLLLWLLIYTFVAIQMAWVLRPFIGDPGRPVQFFRPGAWDNAYVIVARTLRDALNGH